jgi:predicted amidohydrolase
MKIHCVQLNIQWEDKLANFRRVETLLRATPPARDSMVLLPEMFATGFSMEVGVVRDRRDRETERFLAGVAKEFGVWVTGGLVTAPAGGRGNNVSVTVNPDGRVVARYAKLQPFTPGGEADHYDAGDRVVTWNWQGVTVAPFICYDLRFPEHFRAAARAGAQLFTVIANWPVGRIHHWVTLLQARAIENQAFVAGVNRCGNDPKLAYNGRSLIVGPKGEILSDAGNGESVIGAELDLAALEEYRREFPFLKDMRP